MKTIITLYMLAMLAACATEPAAPDPFTLMAEEWQGANINEMIQVWGSPRQLQETDDDGGVVRWAHYAGSDDRATRCVVVAEYDSSGIIYSIDVTSTNCDATRNRNISELQRP